MEITTIIDSEANLRSHEVSGTCSLEDILACLNSIYDRPDYQPDMNVIWDLRLADLSLFSTTEIKDVRDFVKNFWGTGGNSRAALVVSGDLDFGISRIYEMFSINSVQSKIQIFRDYIEALDWVQS